MRFKVSKVPTLGERVLLHNVAVSMAYADANTSRGFIEQVFKRALVRYLKMLVEAARSGNLEITDIDGVRGTMAQIISRAQASASFLRSENPNAAEALVAFTFLPMLNKWGEPFGFSFEFSGRHIHARIMEEGTVYIFSDNPLSPLTFESKIVTNLNETLNEEVTSSGWLTNDTSDEGITDSLKNETPQQAASLPLEHISHKSMELKRKQAIDENKFRGAKRSIIENWGNIESLHHGTADGHKVLRILKRLDSTLNVKVKTIQNILSSFRKEGLIP